MRIQILFLFGLLSVSHGFTTTEAMPHQHRALVVRCPQTHTTSSSSSSGGGGGGGDQRLTLGSWLPVALLSGLLTMTSPVWAEDGVSSPSTASPTTVPSIEACYKKAGGTTNCVSTRNVKQLDLYAPPWTFESSAEEALARLKGVVAADPNLELIQQQDNSYLLVKATRSAVFTDTLQFVINPQDKVVTFKAEQDGEPSISDFGAIRKELDTIRQRGQIFGVMGQGVMSADTMPSQNGPIGQLKAFYGLQSGQGYEDVFEED